MCHPHIIVSLLASKIFLLVLANFIVGSRPAIPTIAEIVISNFNFFNLKSLKLLKILTLFFLCFFFSFLKPSKSLIITYFGLYFYN